MCCCAAATGAVVVSARRRWRRRRAYGGVGRHRALASRHRSGHSGRRGGAARRLGALVGGGARRAPCVAATAAGSRRGGAAARLLRWCRNGVGSDGGRCALVMCSHVVVRTIVVWSRTRSAIHCHTHTTGLHAMTSPPAAPPHHEAPSAAARVGMPRSCFLGPWGLFFEIFLSAFWRSRSCDAEKGTSTAERWPKNRELRKRGAVSSENKRNGPSPHTNDRVRTETRSTGILELGELRTARVLNCSYSYQSDQKQISATSAPHGTHTKGRTTARQTRQPPPHTHRTSTADAPPCLSQGTVHPKAGMRLFRVTISVAVVRSAFKLLCTLDWRIGPMQARLDRTRTQSHSGHGTFPWCTASAYPPILFLRGGNLPFPRKLRESSGEFLFLLECN